MSVQRLVESRLAELQERRKKLIEAWKPYIDAVELYLKEKENREISEFDKGNIAQCLENTLLDSAGRSKLFETTEVVRQPVMVG